MRSLVVANNYDLFIGVLMATRRIFIIVQTMVSWWTCDLLKLDTTVDIFSLLTLCYADGIYFGEVEELI